MARARGSGARCGANPCRLYAGRRRRPNLLPGPHGSSHRNSCLRVVPMLLRAGSPTPPREGWLSGFYIPFIARMRLSRLLEKVAAAGSWAAYERAHRARLARVFIPKLQ